MTKLLLMVFSILMILSCNPSSKSEDRPGSQSEQINESDGVNTEFQPTVTDIPMLIGTYTRKEGHVDGKAEGVYLVYLNTETGLLNLKDTFEAGVNPSYLVIHPTGKYVYAVNETGGISNELYGSLSAFSVDEEFGLTLLNTKSTEGIAPCHVSLDNQGTNVLVANYVTGSVTSFPTAMDGRLAGNQDIIRYRGKGSTDRQTTAHAHYIAQLENEMVITADLGTDSLRFHNFDSGQLTTTDKGIALPPGSGPRHIVTHPVLEVLYVVNELNATVSSFRPNAAGVYQDFQTISTLQEGAGEEGHCAAIKITPDGRFLYVSNRGIHNNIAIFEVDVEGKLDLVGHQSSLGNVPRDIEISPNGDFLVAANQNSDNLISFKINTQSGLLSNPSKLTGIATPVCIKFF